MFFWVHQSILKETNAESSLEGQLLKLKLQYFGHLVRRIDSFEKTLMLEDWRQEEKGTTEDEMVGWHHRLDGHELEQAPGDNAGQGGLAAAAHGVERSRTAWVTESIPTQWLSSP